MFIYPKGFPPLPHVRLCLHCSEVSLLRTRVFGEVARRKCSTVWMWFLCLIMLSQLWETCKWRSLYQLFQVSVIECDHLQQCDWGVPCVQLLRWGPWRHRTSCGMQSAAGLKVTLPPFKISDMATRNQKKDECYFSSLHTLPKDVR